MIAIRHHDHAGLEGGREREVGCEAISATAMHDDLFPPAIGEEPADADMPVPAGNGSSGLPKHVIGGRL